MLRDLLLSVGLPGAAALVLLLVAWRPWRRAAGAPRGAWGGALGFGAAFCLSFLAQAGRPALPPAERWQWLLFLAIAVAILGLAAAVLPRPGLTRWPITALLGLAAAAMIDPPRFPPAVGRAAVGVAVVLLALLLEPLAARRRGILLPLGLLVALASLAFVLFTSGNARLTMMTAALAASCGAAAAVALLAPGLTLARGGVLVLAALMPSVAALGWAYDYAELSPLSFALPVAAPLAIWVAELPALRPRPRAAAASGLGAALTCAAAAAALAAGA